MQSYRTNKYIYMYITDVYSLHKSDLTEQSNRVSVQSMHASIRISIHVHREPTTTIVLENGFSTTHKLVYNLTQA